MVWLYFIQMHRVSRCYPSEIPPCCEETFTKNKTWGRMGFTWFTGYRTFWREGWQELKAGTRGRKWGSMEEHCVLACFLDCSAAFFILQGSTHSDLHTQWAITETLPQTLHRAIRWSSSRVEVSFYQVWQGSNEAKCAGCRVWRTQRCGAGALEY